MFQTHLGGVLLVDRKIRNKFIVTESPKKPQRSLKKTFVFFVAPLCPLRQKKLKRAQSNVGYPGWMGERSQHPRQSVVKRTRPVYFNALFRNPYVCASNQIASLPLAMTVITDSAQEPDGPGR